MPIIIEEKVGLRHYGTKGMKWGIRKTYGQQRSKYASSRLKAKAISTGAKHRKDKALAKYHSQSLATRLGSKVGGQVAIAIFKDLVTAGMDPKKLAYLYRKAPSPVIAKKVGKIAVTSIIKTLKDDALSRNVSKRYAASGELKTGIKKYRISPEQKILFADKAVKAAATAVVLLKANRIVKKADAEKAYRDFGDRILSDPKVIDLKFKE